MIYDIFVPKEDRFLYDRIEKKEEEEKKEKQAF